MLRLRLLLFQANILLFIAELALCHLGDEKVCVHLMITVQSSGAQRLFDHPVYVGIGLLICSCLIAHWLNKQQQDGFHKDSQLLSKQRTP